MPYEINLGSGPSRPTTPAKATKPKQGGKAPERNWKTIGVIIAVVVALAAVGISAYQSFAPPVGHNMGSLGDVGSKADAMKGVPDNGGAGAETPRAGGAGMEQPQPGGAGMEQPQPGGAVPPPQQPAGGAPAQGPSGGAGMGRMTD